MKIAVVTDDETTVCQHFGRAEYYMVFTVEDGKIKSKERRNKVGHRHFAGSESGHPDEHGPHGCGPEAAGKHASMASAISDCQVLIAGGMGMGAYDSMKSYNIEPIVTDITSIEQAVNLYLEGKLPNLMGRLH
ncbi:MAG: NifB/NifX family molybdenum-iron cluster-binding protein [Chloroflexi bacterium]|nr:NifB/NifX family molybdenum-iron cluster-binding protein [Chloroflexota bacterium]